MITLSDLKAFIERGFGKSVLKESDFSENGVQLKRYAIEIGAPYGKLIVYGIAQGEVPINNFRGNLANYVTATDFTGDEIHKHLFFNVSGNWKVEVLRALNIVKANVIVDTQEDNSLEISIKAISMYHFDDFLQSLVKHLRSKGALTERQLYALGTVRNKYIPIIPLRKNQEDFLKKMASLPAKSMEEYEYKLIPEMYAKACAGKAWTDEERNEVMIIMKKYGKM